ncbi:MAG: YdcF family protein [Calothrix sp. C42_A2020_038]|nr:YdcF family protein [Calothrix sp. C42_A2020_038]
MHLDYNIKQYSFGLVLLVIAVLTLPLTATALNIYFYNTKSKLKSADAAIVLGAEVWQEKPSPVFRERINHAINLYKQGKVSSIIFTGGIGDDKDIAEATVGKDYAIANGVNESDILIETRSRTTLQNLKNAKTVASSEQLSEFLIVSDPLHLKRATLMARDLGMNAYPSATPTTRYQSAESKLKFLIRETSAYFIYLIYKFGNRS